FQVLGAPVKSRPTPPMLVAEPAGAAPWTFDLLEKEHALSKEGRPVARVRLLKGGAAEVTVGVVPFGVESDRRGRHFVLTFEGVEVARAQQPAAWRRRLLVLVRGAMLDRARAAPGAAEDRKSTRLNSSHVKISYAVFC